MYHGLTICTGDNPLAKARGLPPRTGRQTIYTIISSYRRTNHGIIITETSKQKVVSVHFSPIIDFLCAYHIILQTYGRTGNIGDIQFILRYNGEGKQSTIEIRKMGAFVPTGTNLKYLKQWTSSGRLLDKITYSDVVYKSKGRSL